MSKPHKCVYCKYWIESPVRKKDAKTGLTRRKCRTRGRLVNSDSFACKYFNPHRTIWCDNYHQRSEMILCLQRRRNPGGFKKSYNKCLKCRQFDLEIQDLINDYYLENTEIIEPDKKIMGRKIKRRAGHEKKRVIKRRSKPEKKKKRTITRRKKKRVIKRRIK